MDRKITVCYCKKGIRIKMKRVLLISREYYPTHTTGMAVYIDRIIKKIDSLFFYIITFCRFYKTKKNIKIVQQNENNLVKKSRYLSALWFFLLSIIRSFDKKFDVIVGNSIIGGISGVFVKLFTRKPLISVVYDVDFIRKEVGVYGFFGRFIRRIVLEIMFHSSDKLMVMSRFSKNEILQMCNMNEKRIRVIEAGCIELKKKDLERNMKIYEKLKTNKKGYVILFVGEIHPKKGLEYAIEAMPNITARFKNLQFYIIGSEFIKNYGDYLKRLVKRKNLDKNIKFLGRVENVDLWPYYKICDVYLAPSIRTDCFGMPIIEASAFGKPSVATTLFEKNGVIINNKTGLVIPTKDSKAIENAVIRLLEDETLRKKLGRNAQTFSKNFTWSKSAKKFENLIREVI
jgi:glycosyltransferase involved in cell wall biosynthesis